MHLKFKRLTQPDTFFDLKTLLLSMFLYWSHLKGTFEVAVLRAYLIGLASQHQPSTFFKTGNALYLLSAGINSWSSPSGGGWPTFRSRLCQRELTSKSRFSQDSCFMARYYVIVRETEPSLPTAKKKLIIGIILIKEFNRKSMWKPNAAVHWPGYSLFSTDYLTKPPFHALNKYWSWYYIVNTSINISSWH